MDITAIKQPVDRQRLATILDEAFGLSEYEAPTEQLLTMLEAELLQRRQLYEAERETREALGGELAAWRSGALSLADCTCKSRRQASAQCPVHSQLAARNRLPAAFIEEAQSVLSRLREPRGSNLCARDRELCCAEFEKLVRRFL